MKHVYNTGKVKIGEYYTPPAQWPDKDAEDVQKALLSKGRQVNWDNVTTAFCIVLLLAVLFMSAAGWLPGQ